MYRVYEWLVSECFIMVCLYMCVCGIFFLFFFFKQKTAYEMRISDWSSDVCSSDLTGRGGDGARFGHAVARQHVPSRRRHPGSERRGRSAEIGRASCRERVCQYV